MVVGLVQTGNWGIVANRSSMGLCRTGQLTGVVVQAGTHTISIRLIKAGTYQVVPVVIVAG
jgi:hypothetical protein